MAKIIPVGDKTLSAETIVDDLTGSVVALRFLLTDADGNAEEIPAEVAQPITREYNLAHPNG
jgi:hypothetical protein